MFHELMSVGITVHHAQVALLPAPWSAGNQMEQKTPAATRMRVKRQVL
jgi:hypothetical protein